MIESGYYPPGAEFDASAPYNEVEVPEKDFEITCSQSLSRTVVVTTSNYIPCVDEGCEDGVGYHDEWADTSNTEWSKVYSEDHYTPLQLIGMYKEALEEQLKSWEGMEDTYAGRMQIRRIEHLIEECENWTDDETEFVEE